MKAIEYKKDIGFVLSKTRANCLKKQCLGDFRRSLKSLFLLGVLNMDQVAQFELKMDTIVYLESVRREGQK